MKKSFIFFVLFLLPFSLIFAGNKICSSDSAAIVQTALDYGDGYYSGDATRMERALHPDFNKVSPMKMSETGNTFLYFSTFSGLVEYTRINAGFLSEEKRKEKVEIFRIDGDIAFAKITTAMFNDYLVMVKINEQWKIVNVLWTSGEDAPAQFTVKDFVPENEKEPVKTTVTEMFEGIFTGDVTKIEKSLHYEYNGIVLGKLKNNATILNKNGFSTIKEIAQSKMMLLDKDKWNLQITTLEIKDGFAAVIVDLPESIFYLQLAKLDGQWKIINSLRKSLKK
jgi:hypothetical protein